MLVAAFLLQLGLHGLTGAVSFLLGGQSAGDHAAGGTMLSALLLVAVIGVAALGTAIEIGRRRAGRRPGEVRRVADAGVDGLARRDALTGLPSRAALCEHLGTVLGAARRGEHMAAVLHVDLADFREINERLGCVAGDVLLRHASARMLAALRDCDMLARTGADEFAVVQRGIEGPAAAAALAERLLAVVAAPFELCGELTDVGARIGIAMFPSDGDEAEVLLQHASLALGRASAEPPGAFCFFEDALDAELRERRGLEQDLGQALARGEFEIEYQPQFDIQSRRMFGVEALLRWQHAERGRIGPDQFIPLAEDSGLILPIGRWVLEQACMQAVAWQEQGARDLRMAVNLSPVQCRDPELAAQVAEILCRSGLAPGKLELEITERVLMEHTRANLETLAQLKQLGVRISIDDFGVGHSSFGYLQRFPFDEIKLDRSFVGALECDPSAQAIVRAALMLGRSLGLDSIAEGVESAAQLQLLDAEGCRLAQGFYFSPPVHPREIDAMVAATAGATDVDSESALANVMR